MGACSSSNEPSIHHKIGSIDCIPSDTDSLKNVPLPFLSFSALITDIKIKKCSYVYFSLSRTSFALSSKSKKLMSSKPN